MQDVSDPAARFEMTHKRATRICTDSTSPTSRRRSDRRTRCRDGADDLGAMLRFDRRYFLAGLLNIDDKMCGRHSLESRPSLLHQDLVRHMLKLDPTELLSNGDLKPVLRRDRRADICRESCRHRSDKMGFTTPIGTFVNQSSGFIREQITSSPFRDLYDLRKMNLTAETKFSREVFGLLMLDLWLNEYAACQVTS